MKPRNYVKKLDEFISGNKRLNYCGKSVNYDGGYTALGYIAGIEYQFNVTMEDDSGEIYADGKSEVIELLNSFEAGTVIRKGVFLKFYACLTYIPAFC